MNKQPSLKKVRKLINGKITIYRNWRGDLYWGADKDGKGENMLGKI